MVISFAFRFITNSLAFWITDARGLNYLTEHDGHVLLRFHRAAQLFSGKPCAPLWTGSRFGALAHLPVSIYLGKAERPTLLTWPALQVAWLVVLVLGGRFILGRMVHRLTSAGG